MNLPKDPDLDEKQDFLRVDAVLVKESVGPANTKGLVVNVASSLPTKRRQVLTASLLQSQK
jgi:hypothetical protein